MFDVREAQDKETGNGEAYQYVAMADWMVVQGVTHVAMESTGCFGNQSTISWKAVLQYCW